MATYAAGSSEMNEGWVPLDPEVDLEALEGDADVKTLSVSEGLGGVDTGYATAQPAKVRTRLGRTEVLYVIEGRVTADLEGGVTVDLRPGDFIHLEPGQLITWTYHEPVRLFYVLHGERQ